MAVTHLFIDSFVSVVAFTFLNFMTGLSITFDIFKGEPSKAKQLFSCRTAQLSNDPIHLFQQEILSSGAFCLTKRTPIESLLQYEKNPTCFIEAVVTRGEKAEEVYSRYRKWVSHLYHKHRAALAIVPGGLVAFIPFTVHNGGLETSLDYGMKCVYLTNIKINDLQRKDGEENVASGSSSSSGSWPSVERRSEQQSPSQVRAHEDVVVKDELVRFVSASGKVKLICEVEDCTKVAQSRKRCKRHGGGPRCRFAGCTKSSQGKGRCRTHGGGKQCKVEECTSGAQQRGFCSRHGGAKLCKEEGCERHSRGSGLCAFHGGGKKCSVEGCKNSSRLSGLCAMHKRQSENESKTTSV